MTKVAVSLDWKQDKELEFAGEMNGTVEHWDRL